MADLETTSETADRLDGIALDGVTAYQTELQDGPVAARQAYRDSADALHQISAVGSTTAAQAATLRAEAVDLARKFGDSSEASRMKATEAADLVRAAHAQIADLSARAHLLTGVVEATLKSSLIPALPDSATRALARAEIDRATKGLKGAHAVAALRHLATADDPALVSELFSDYTARIIGDAEHVQMFRTLAVATLLQHPSNARRAAQVAGLGRARGSIDAARVGALTRFK